MQTAEMSEVTSNLAEAAKLLIHNHLAVKKNKTDNLYQILLEAIEPALFKAVLENTHYNQSKSARRLGLSRGTFRTKLAYYFGDTYVGTRAKEL